MQHTQTFTGDPGGEHGHAGRPHPAQRGDQLELPLPRRDGRRTLRRRVQVFTRELPQSRLSGPDIFAEIWSAQKNY